MSKPLGPGGALGKTLYPDLKPGQEASVLNTAYPHNGHVDATLYGKAPDGRVYQVDKMHLEPKTLRPIK